MRLLEFLFKVSSFYISCEYSHFLSSLYLSNPNSSYSLIRNFLHNHMLEIRHLSQIKNNKKAKKKAQLILSGLFK